MNKFKTLKRNNKKIVGIILTVILISVVFVNISMANYKAVKSLSLADGTVSYAGYDLYIDAYIDDGSGSYNQVTTIPSGDYLVNKKMSICSNGAIVSGTNTNLEVSNLSTLGIKCTVYFESDPCMVGKNETSVSSLLAELKAVSGGELSSYPNVTSGCSINEIADPMYGDDTTRYYYRGAVAGNWVSFAGYYWRILGINGDGSMRLIYTGTSDLTDVTVDNDGITATGTGTYYTTSKYNSSYGALEYVGYTYTSESQRPQDTINDFVSGLPSGTASTIKEVVDSFYSSLDSSYQSKIVAGYYCNDRDSSETWQSDYTDEVFYYAPVYRKYGIPTLDCSNAGDIYELYAGLITLDEVRLAGAYGTSYNPGYFLYTNESYWTMSPNGKKDQPRALVYYLQSGSYFWDSVGVSSRMGVRPVINISADASLSGSGTFSDPYIVS